MTPVQPGVFPDPADLPDQPPLKPRVHLNCGAIGAGSAQGRAIVAKWRDYGFGQCATQVN
jgi:hypothetical protein